MRALKSPLVLASAIGFLLLLMHVALGRDVLFVQAACGSASQGHAAGTAYRYRPKTRVPPTLESIFNQLAAGSDEFPEEKQAEELAARLSELGTRLREGPARAADVADWLLAADFKG